MDSAGSRIRSARRARGMSLRALAEKVGVSASMLSLLENGRSRSSVRTLYAVVEALDMTMDELFAEPGPSSAPPPPAPDGPEAPSSAITVVRAEHRRRIEMETGVIWERLGRNANDGLEFMLVIYPPGAKSSDSGRYQRHNGLECAHVMQGELTCRVGFEEVTLHAGDSITFDSSRPHLLENGGTEEVRAVWVVLHRHAEEAPSHLPGLAVGDRGRWPDRSS
ncbi:helix-turn-helix domain-containing protein [Amycolatopsis pigmentata]|uniref:Helix-turn-helix domain-containing protein n=1 Tax=Amycolatopsis pigmentata TaxID=450801 RepID=A0ABW5FKI9_9PSEU